ncbi:MAG: AAA family ATPase [Patescibacteria group bacterium]
MLFIVFGLPGAGKTYVGRLLKDEFGFYLYDGDNQLTDEMKKALKEKKLFNDSMRDVFFQRLINKVLQLHKTKKNLVVAQTFIKEKYRKQLLKAMPFARFILVQTKKVLREKRLLQRDDLDQNYVKSMIKLFEKPTIEHLKTRNDTDGKIQLIKKLENFLHNQKINY